jgi:hypothetical protein
MNSDYTIKKSQDKYISFTLIEDTFPTIIARSIVQLTIPIINALKKQIVMKDQQL